MKFEEPKVEFVGIDINLVTTGSSCEGAGTAYSCDDELVADFDICNCYPSGSDVVTIINS